MYKKLFFYVGIVDKTAFGLRPAGLENLFPVLTEPDGNCVPRSLSLLCFGEENHNIEMRCRIVLELVTNQFDYLCFNRMNWNLFASFQTMPVPVAA